MRTLVIGDLHGCADELSALLKQANPTRIIFVGDLFTKGPDPVGCYSLIQSLGAEAVLGNHDAAMLAGETPAGTQLDRHDPAWRQWLSARPLTLQVGEFIVVHAGLHPTGGVDETTREIALNCRRWPMHERKAPLWHALYTCPSPVIFGHDAIRGLVRIEKEGAPHLIGLDSGCVYGGRLSGYLIEEDRLFSVRAQRVYRAVTQKL